MPTDISRAMPRSGSVFGVWCAPFFRSDDVRNGAGVIEVAAVKLFAAGYFPLSFWLRLN